MFITRSEPEMHKGFADIFFEPFLFRYPDVKYSYLLELKYIKRGELTPEVLAAKAAEARMQLDKYAQDPHVQKTVGHTKLRKLLAVFHGWELVAREEA